MSRLRTVNGELAPAEGREGDDVTLPFTFDLLLHTLDAFYTYIHPDIAST